MGGGDRDLATPAPAGEWSAPAPPLFQVLSLPRSSAASTPGGAAFQSSAHRHSPARNNEQITALHASVTKYGRLPDGGGIEVAWDVIQHISGVATERHGALGQELTAPTVIIRMRPFPSHSALHSALP